MSHFELLFWAIVLGHDLLNMWRGREREKTRRAELEQRVACLERVAK